MRIKSVVLVFMVSFLFINIGCDKDDNVNNNNNSSEGPMLIFKFKFDPSQERLGNFGEPAAMPVATQDNHLDLTE